VVEVVADARGIAQVLEGFVKHIDAAECPLLARNPQRVMAYMCWLRMKIKRHAIALKKQNRTPLSK
jgi:hypothetical protein